MMKLTHEECCNLQVQHYHEQWAMDLVTCSWLTGATQPNISARNCALKQQQCISFTWEKDLCLIIGPEIAAIVTSVWSQWFGLSKTSMNRKDILRRRRVFPALQLYWLTSRHGMHTACMHAYLTRFNRIPFLEFPLRKTTRRHRRWQCWQGY